MGRSEKGGLFLCLRMGEMTFAEHPYEKTKAPNPCGPGPSTCPVNSYDYLSRSGESQCYGGDPPVLSLLYSPLIEGEWTRRDSNPHLATGQVDVLPLHHRPYLRLELRQHEKSKVTRHIVNFDVRIWNE